jgi:phage baseplate assembly protein W
MYGLEEFKPLRLLQTRETFPVVASSPLGKVQITDELGLAYLDQDIDFGAVGRFEVFQNVKFILTTAIWSVPLDREFGMDYSMIDKPIPIAEAMLSQEIAMKIALYEPRVRFEEVSFSGDGLQGKLNPNVRIAILSTDELPSMSRGGGESSLTAVVQIAPTLPSSFLEMLAHIQGIPGPQGPQGNAATITVGQTITGLPGTDADVTNIGTSGAAIFDFVIPRGDKGDQGTGITIKGTVPTSSALPATGNVTGDMWIAADTGHGWSWDGVKWIDVGPIQGPVGPQGPQGATGSQGPVGPTGTAATVAVGTTTTLSPVSGATVTNSGNQNAATFNFGIPRGSQWWSGAADPVTVAGSLPGDYYLNTTSGDVFLLS